ncbi:hypothetical protein ABMA28_016714 [Loxostege sticticalis]|uniref:FP protein C-terminal domain-containing protein n=1 Tax=Loxostege sticticalis TaxID=481309 RepID=A0ABD0T5K9_LOXSC
MNTQRTPPGGSTGSHPNLSQLTENEFHDQITLRKRKTPDCDNICFELFRRELNNTMAAHRQELRNTVQELQKSISSSFESLVEKQNESIRKLHEDLCTLKSEVYDLKLNQHSIQKEHNDFVADLSKQKNDHNNLCEKTKTLECDLIDAKKQIKELTEQQNIKDQQGRINNLEISGVPQTKGENLYNVLHIIATKIGFALSSADVDFIHRVRRFTTKAPRNNLHTHEGESTASSVPNIIVKFTQRKRKCEFLAAVRARRGLTTADLDIDGASSPIFINDHLTPHNKVIYARARRLGKELGYKYIWLNDCKIFLRKSDTTKSILINNEKDLDRIK